MQNAPAQAELFTCGEPPEFPFPESCQYLPGFLPRDQASALLQTLHADLPWQQRAIMLFGRKVMQPRLVCWQADPKVDYGYSGIRLVPDAWHPQLSKLRQRLREELGLEFNAVLVNAYRDGRDSMGWHADDEPELGPEPVLASVSLGFERVFRWRHKQSGSAQGLRLQHGSLLLLFGAFQRDYLHCVPKTRTAAGLRINLTFRQVLQTH